jgi:hypothetical protein
MFSVRKKSINLPHTHLYLRIEPETITNITRLE